MKDRIKEVRKMCNLSQQKFANELGVSLSNIESYEMGRRNPSEAFIQLLNSKYGINIEWLRTGEGEMRSPLSREAEIARITAQMFKEDESSFRYQLQKLIADLNTDQLEVLRDIARKLVDIMDQENNESLPK